MRPARVPVLCHGYPCGSFYAGYLVDQMKALVKDRVCDNMLWLPGCVLAKAGVSYISSGNGSSVAAAKLVSLLQKSTETAKSRGGPVGESSRI
jgi:hypothetical protein